MQNPMNSARDADVISNQNTAFFQGRQENAQYLDQSIWRYRGNPFIEALPVILTAGEASKKMAYYPPYDESERKLSPEERVHLTHAALDLFIPLPDHTDLEQRFSCLIRSGYVPRNPVAIGHWQRVGSAVGAIRTQPQIRSNPVHSAPAGFNIIGISGGGKTTAVEAVLNLYPQVIFHAQYQDRAFNNVQVVWLKMSCPHDGSTRGLCINFFKAVDELVGTHHYRNYAQGRRTTDELMPCMAQVAAMHGLGVLIIDEIQHLSESKSGGRERMLNFFCELTNRIGLPVVFVGTFKALRVLGSEFRQIRRGCSEGEKRWERLTDANTWKFFVKSLWRYQYTAKPTLLTPELSDLFYERTQGIPDLCVKLYMLSQVRAIRTGIEQITPIIVNSVARDCFRSAEPVLDALRTNNTAALELISDVHPLDFDSCVRAIDTAAGSTSLIARNAPVQKTVTRIDDPQRKSRDRASTRSDVSGYDRLKAQGTIRSGAEFMEATV